MKPKFEIQLERFEALAEIEGHWSRSSFEALLEAMEYGDTSGLDDAELREMTLLSLQDRSATAAAALLLHHRLHTRLTRGQIETLAHDLAEGGEKLWEHHADMSLHEELFAVGSLASQAFPAVFPTPDAVRVTLKAEAINASAKAALARGLREPMLARILADGMPPSAILKRLFEDQLAGQAFPEAESIIWTFRASAEKTGVTLELISSGYWLDPIADADRYESSTHP